MKYAPKLLLIATLSAFVFWSCQDQSKKKKPGLDTEIEKPVIKENDSTRPTAPSLPDARHPERTKKKKTGDLDSLRAIKA